AVPRLGTSVLADIGVTLTFLAMVDPSRWFKSTPLQAQAVARAASSEAAAKKPAPPAVVVPIRSIGPGQLERIEAHLLELDAHDRYLRFGYAANDEQIRRYVAQLNFERD